MAKVAARQIPALAILAPGAEAGPFADACLDPLATTLAAFKHAPSNPLRMRRMALAWLALAQEQG